MNMALQYNGLSTSVTSIPKQQLTLSMYLWTNARLNDGYLGVSRLRKVDVYSPLPADLVEEYDMVNVRLFTCVARDNEPLPVLKHLLRC